MRHLLTTILLLLATVVSAAPADSLSLKKVDIDEVVVSARHSGKVVLSNERLMESIPAVMGEYDVVKYIISLPGVVSPSILDPNFYVRGGAGSENRYYVSGFPVSSPQHLSGILSLFDPYVLRNSTLYKSGYPAQYSGVLSSYLNMFPTMERDSVARGELSLGLVSSSVRAALPVGEGDGLFAISARCSYLEAMMNLINSFDNASDIIPYSYGDITSSYSQSLSQRWRLKLFGLYSVDDLAVEDDMTFDWNSYSVNGVAQRQGERSTLSLGVGTWGGERSGDFNIFVSAPLEFSDHSLRGQLAYDYNLTPQTQLSVGASLESTHYLYGALASDVRSYLGNSYLALDHTTSQGVNILGGVNLEQYYGRGSSTQLLPRLRTSYDWSETLSLWFDYARTAQYTTQLTILSVPSPADITMTMAEGQNPILCDQISLGAEGSPRPWLSLYGALFFRRYTDVKEAVDISLSQSISSLESIEYASGRGEASGVEFEARVAQRDFTARVNYTYTNSWRQFAQINGGERYNPPYDITHNIVVTGEYRLSERLKLSAMWQYSSGVYITFPVGVAVAENVLTGGSIVLPIYDDIYNYRLPATHRLDVSGEYSMGQWSLSAGAYNIYNQNNISYIDFVIRSDDNYSSYIVPRGLTLLPIIPYISISYKW